MKREEIIAALDGIKNMTSVVSIHSMLEMLNAMEPEVKVVEIVGMSQELADKLFEKIESVLDYNSGDLVDKDTAEFSLSHDNRIELDRVDIDVRGIMEHVDAVFEDFIIPPVLEAEEAEEEDEAADEAEETAMGFEIEFEESREKAMEAAWSFPRGEDEE